jgi:hypothetical protein
MGGFRGAVATLLLVALLACTADSRPSALPPTPVFDVTRVVQIEAVSCSNRVRRGQAIRLANGAYLTAAHTVTDARHIVVGPLADGSVVDVATMSTDQRTDLALLSVGVNDPLDGLSLDEWAAADPGRSATIVTSTRQRDVTVSAAVIVRASSPDGSRREWRGVRVWSGASPGDSGAPVVQGGRPIGVLVQTERGADRSWSVSSQEVYEFVSIRSPLSGEAETDYPQPIRSSGESIAAQPVGSTCR